MTQLLRFLAQLRGLIGTSLCIAAGTVVGSEAPLKPTHLRCEHLREPVAIAGANPRLSWQWEGRAARYEVVQYRIQAATSETKLAQGTFDLWDSGYRLLGAAMEARYRGRRLASGDLCCWRVQIVTSKQSVGPWSEVATFRAGLERKDWRGPWVGAPNDDQVDTANQLYRKVIQVPRGAQSCLAYVASVGYHELYVNGQRVGDAELAPATSDLSQRVRYVAYDVTSLVKPGENVFGIALGAGWTLYTGPDWSAKASARWPNRPALRLQINIRNGAARPLAEYHADPTWRTHAADIQPLSRWQARGFTGERLTPAAALIDWNQPSYNDSAWSPAVVRASADKWSLTAQEVEPNRVRRQIPVKNINRIEDGTYQVELAQMFTGLLEVDLTGKPGSVVSIEASDRADVPCTYSQRNELILDATGRGHFRNRFAYVSGQWVTIRGDIQPPQAEDVRALLVTTDLTNVGHFECNDELHNRIYNTALHTFDCLSLGGYVVDCAHRERLGYGGDGHATAMLALANYRCAAFYEKWLRDWGDMQQPDGNLPFSAPMYGGGGGPAWSGFVVNIGADLYQRTGDLEVVKRIYPTVERWLAYLAQHVVADQLQRYDGPADYVSHQWSFLGDWVDPGHDQSPNGDSPETHFFNNCYYVLTLRRAANLAEVLGKTEQAAIWRADAERITRATHAKYWNAEQARYVTDRQASVAIALVADIMPAALKSNVEQRLVDLIVHSARNHLDTGIGGTSFLLQALHRMQRTDLGILIASQRDFPSWGDMLQQGATAFWEQWDGKNSRCHSSYLGIGGWYIEAIAGIQSEWQDPGYRTIRFRPGFNSGLEWAEGSLDTAYGIIRIKWRQEAERVEVELSVPPRCEGVLELPPCYLLVTSATIQAAPSLKRLDADRHQIDLASGTHRLLFIRMND